MSLSARGLQRTDDRNFAATTTPLNGPGKKLTWKLVLDYLKNFNKFNSSILRFKFPRKCLDKDIIPDFYGFACLITVFFRIKPCTASN